MCSSDLSLSGLGFAIREESAFRQELALAVVLIPLGLFLPLAPVERVLQVGSAKGVGRLLQRAGQLLGSGAGGVDGVEDLTDTRGQGGDGGRGGSIFLRAVPSVGTLLDLQHRRHVRADPGGNGARRKQHGKKGSDVVVDVPLGTVITDESDSELIADLRFPFEEVMVARGGRGGLGNTHFATSSNRARARRT